MIMADFLVDELVRTGLAIGMGMAYAFIYDFLRIIRNVIKHHYVAVSGEDLLFWIITAEITFYFLLVINEGNFRFYVVAAIFLGIMVYRLSISKWFVRFLSFFLLKFVKIIKKILKKLFNMIRMLLYKLKRDVLKIRGEKLEKKNEKKQTL